MEPQLSFFAEHMEVLNAQQLLAHLPGGFPPRYTKLAPSTWRRAAQLFAKRGGTVSLRVLCSECGVSHRTAWRMREALRDSDQILKERRHLGPLEKNAHPPKE